MYIITRVGDQKYAVINIFTNEIVFIGSHEEANKWLKDFNGGVQTEWLEQGQNKIFH